MNNDEIKKITVKRKTWILGRVIPITLYFNNNEIGKISASEEKELIIPGGEGVLKYKLFLEKENQITAEDGDYILLKDTVSNKIANIIFFGWFIILLISLFFNEHAGVVESAGPIFLIGFILILISMFFFSSYKFIKIKD